VFKYRLGHQPNTFRCHPQAGDRITTTGPFSVIFTLGDLGRLDCVRAGVTLASLPVPTVARRPGNRRGRDPGDRNFFLYARS